MIELLKITILTGFVLFTVPLTGLVIYEIYVNLKE